MKKKTLRERLPGYTALGASFLALAPHEAEAQLTYVDLPDQEFCLRTTTVTSENQTIYLDLDGKAVGTTGIPGADVSFRLNNSMGGYFNTTSYFDAWAGIYIDNPSNFLGTLYGGSTYYVKNANEGDVINAPFVAATDSSFVFIEFTVYTSAPSVITDPTYWGATSWRPAPAVPVNDVTGYLVANFDIGGVPQQAWLQVNVKQTVGGLEDPQFAESCMTILDYGYRPASQPLTVGEKPVEEPIPTLSEWGLITLSLLLLSFGTVLIGRREQVLTGESNSAMKIGGKFQRPPFYSKHFKRALIGTGILAAIMAIFSQIAYGGITAVDFFGTMVAGPIFAYLMHLITAYEEEAKKLRKEE